MGELITFSEAAKRSEISLVTLRKLIRNRNITVYQNPRDAREKLVMASDIEKALQPTPIQNTKKAAA